jgi:hypothetical protein
MVVELRPAPEPPALRLRGCSAVAGTLGDALALVLGDGRRAFDRGGAVMHGK